VLGLVGWPGVTATGAALIVAIALYVWLDARFESQIDRNRYLSGEIAKLDRQIEEIAKIKEQTTALLARKKIAETLGPDRAVAGALLDLVARLRGDRIVLRSVIRSGSGVTISGAGASYLDVDAFIRRVAESGHLEKPRLLEVRTASAGKAPDHAIQFTVAAALGGTRDARTPDFREKPLATVSGDPK
jgi:type IV pilus assembly protein PilN